MISANTEHRRRHISDYFEALHGGGAPTDAQKPVQKQDEPVKNAAPAPKPNQP